MAERRLIFRTHALRRMFERQVSIEDIRQVLAAGEIIEEYPDDFPYPSRLVLGWRGFRPLHIVAADNITDDETIVITVYDPYPDQWEEGFRRRKS